MNTSAMSQNPSFASPRTPWRVVLAWTAVVLTPLELILGFVLGYAIGLDPSIENPLTGWDAAWRVIILWLIVVALSVAGMVLGLLAHRRGESTALAAVAVNAVVFVGLTLITLVGGLVDAFG